jgi:hypothetical protein
LSGALVGSFRGRQTQTLHSLDLTGFFADARQGAVELPGEPQEDAVNRQAEEQGELGEANLHAGLLTELV